MTYKEFNEMYGRTFNRCPKVKEIEHFQIQLYKGGRCYTLGMAYESMVEAANTMMTWAEAIDADKGHVINDLTGEIVIYF